MRRIVKSSGERFADSVRWPITGQDRSRRAADEALAVRFPGLFRLIARGVGRLPVRSRLRQDLIERAVVQGQAAYNRRDFEAIRPKYLPDVTVHPPAQLVSLGEFAPVYEGHAGLVRFQRQWSEMWHDWRMEPRELIDLGERVMVLGETGGRGLKSGVQVSSQYASLWDLRAGLTVRERWFLSWADALDAAGLRDY